MCGLHNGGVVTHDGTRNLGKVSVKDFVFVGGFGFTISTTEEKRKRKKEKKRKKRKKKRRRRGRKRGKKFC